MGERQEQQQHWLVGTLKDDRVHHITYLLMLDKPTQTPCCGDAVPTRRVRCCAKYTIVAHPCNDPVPTHGQHGLALEEKDSEEEDEGKRG